MSDPRDSTTDVHEAKRQRKPPHPAWQTVIATAVSGALVGGGFGIVRNQDVERMNKEASETRAMARDSANSIIEIKADSRNQDRKLDDIKLTLDALVFKFDAMRDRMPRN